MSGVKNAMRGEASQSRRSVIGNQKLHGERRARSLTPHDTPLITTMD